MIKQSNNNLPTKLVTAIQLNCNKKEYTIYVLCYESSKKKITFHAFKQLIHNLKAYNGVNL